MASTGLDKAGPTLLKDTKVRKPGISKSNICLFVCMVTSAIHVELATDLTTETFLAALRRFISIRWKLCKIYSSGRHTHTITSFPCISVSVTNTKFARGVLKRDVSLPCTEILCRSNKKSAPKLRKKWPEDPCRERAEDGQNTSLCSLDRPLPTTDLQWQRKTLHWS